MDIVSFSGGKDSTAMLLLMIEKSMHIDRIVFVDTTKEFPQMYTHIEKVKSFIKPYEIETVKIDYDYWFADHIKTRGKNKGKKGYGWPDFRNRWCTALKREAFLSQVNSNSYNPRKRGCQVRKRGCIEIIEHHGIAYDEKNRCKKNEGCIIKYPLVDWKITGKQALQYCYSKGFDWGGLYEKMHRVSCWCCPLSRISELRILHNEFPELWDELIRMDKKSFRRFRSDYSIEQLKERLEKQMTEEEEEEEEGSGGVQVVR